MAKRKTTDQFKKDVFNIVGDEYSVLGEYVGANNKIKMRHNNCGREYLVTPSSFLNGERRCSKCSGRMKKNTGQFKEEIFKQVGSEYTVLGEYINAKTKIKIKHNSCGEEYDVTPHSFLMGNRCPKCYGTPRKTTEQFKKEVFDQVGEEYTVLGEYIDAQTKIKMRHNDCEYEYMIKASNFINNHRRCSRCYGTPKKTTEQFKREVYSLEGDTYSVIGEYVNANVDVKMKHNVCGHEYMVKRNDFLNGNRCPKCKESRGERKISDLLDKYNITYERELKFEKCKNIKALPFDFGIFNKNNAVILLIEYDGEQHYKPAFSSSMGKAIERHEYIKRNDNIKTNYCKDNNIPLLRIPYWEFDNVEKIVSEELYRRGLIK